MAEWRKILDGVGVTFGVVGTDRRRGRRCADAGDRRTGAVRRWQTLTVSVPFHLDGEAKVAPRRAPAVGQHSEDVLREAGYSADEIGRLRGWACWPSGRREIEYAMVTREETSDATCCRSDPPGMMGSAVGARLVENGIEVRTLLAGRSEATVARAKAAGMVDA